MDKNVTKSLGALCDAFAKQAPNNHLGDKSHFAQPSSAMQLYSLNKPAVRMVVYILGLETVH